MCMETVDTKEITDKIKNSIGKDGIKVYKVVHTHNSHYYYPMYKRTSIFFEEGTNEADITTRIFTTGGKEHYQSGFHLWLKKEDAEKCRGKANRRKSLKIIECIVKKSWITNTGRNEIYFDTTKCEMILAKTIVAKKIIFPKFKE